MEGLAKGFLHNLGGILCLEEMFCHFSGMKGEIINVTTNPTESQKLTVRN